MSRKLTGKKFMNSQLYCLSKIQEIKEISRNYYGCQGFPMLKKKGEIQILLNILGHMISPPYIVQYYYHYVHQCCCFDFLQVCKVDNKLPGLWELMEQDFNSLAYFIFQVKNLEMLGSKNSINKFIILLYTYKIF